MVEGFRLPTAIVVTGHTGHVFSYRTLPYEVVNTRSGAVPTKASKP